MILSVQRHVHDAIADAVRRTFGLTEVPPFTVEVPPNRAMVKGRAALLKYYEEQFAAAKVNKFSIQHLESHSSGDTGYDVGTYSQTLTPTKAAAVNDTGKYTVILKRVGSAWKVAYAIYNSDLPPPAAGR